MKSFSPYAEYIFMICQSIGRPAISTIGFGRVSVSSDILVPRPPASMTTLLIFICCCCQSHSELRLLHIEQTVTVSRALSNLATEASGSQYTSPLNARDGDGPDPVSSAMSVTGPSRQLLSFAPAAETCAHHRAVEHLHHMCALADLHQELRGVGY